MEQTKVNPVVYHLQGTEKQFDLLDSLICNIGKKWGYVYTPNSQGCKVGARNCWISEFANASEVVLRLEYRGEEPKLQGILINNLPEAQRSVLEQITADILKELAAKKE